MGGGWISDEPTKSRVMNSALLFMLVPMPYLDSVLPSMNGPARPPEGPVFISR